MPKGSKRAPTWHQNPPKSDQKVDQNHPKCVFGPGQGNVFEFAFSLIDLWSHFGSPLGHISTLLAHIWLQKGVLKPTCFSIRFWGELGRPSAQPVLAWGTGSAFKKLESAEQLCQRVQTLWPRSLKHQGLEKTMPKGSKRAPKWHQNPPKSNQQVTQNHPKCVFGPGQGNVFEFAFSLIDLWSHFGSPLGHFLYIFTNK